MRGRLRSHSAEPTRRCLARQGSARTLEHRNRRRLFRMIAHGTVSTPQNPGPDRTEILGLDIYRSVIGTPLHLAIPGRRMFPGPRATPTWSKRRIYFASPAATGLPTQTRPPLWSANVLQKFKGAASAFGTACSPS